MIPELESLKNGSGTAVSGRAIAADGAIIPRPEGGGESTASKQV